MGGDDTPASRERSPVADDASRRTYLAAERTWLAWWRTGLTASAAAIGIGRIAPELVGGRNWPFVVIGVGYAALAFAILVLAGVRHRAVSRALHGGGYAELSEALAVAITAAGALFAVATIVVVLTE